MTDERHAEIQSELPAFALGSLSPSESDAVAAHLKTCGECRSALHEYHEVMRLLPHALPMVSPSPAARHLLLERVHGHEGRRARGLPGWLATQRWRELAAVATLLLILVAGALVVTGERSPEETPVTNPAALLSDLRDRPSVQMLAMTGSEHAPSAVGQIIVDPGDTKAALLVSGLPQLGWGREYQFWFVEPDDSRVSGGIFTVDANGAAIVAIDAPAEFSRAWRCGVTVEPAGGSAAPTGKNVLTASYERPLDAEYDEPG